MGSERPSGARAAGGYIKADSPEPLLEVDQSSFKKLMSLSALPDESRTALAGFKSRWNGSDWMQDQDGYLTKACLAAASSTPTGFSFCRCGLAYRDSNGRHRFMTCRKPLLCPSCNLHLRVERCEWEYLPVFHKASYWYAFVVGWNADPREAGLKWVTEQDERGRPKKYKAYRPWKDIVDAKESLVYSLDCHLELGRMAELAFHFVDDLNRWLSGSYAAFEWHFSFRPRPNPKPEQNGCYHVALPHLNMFGNSPRELNLVDDAKAIFRRYHGVVLDGFGDGRLPSYPDLWICPIPSKADLKRWINYHLKAIRFGEFYRRGIRNGCPLPDLNREFHSVVWEAMNIVRTPRKHGNLYAGDDRYIGVQQYRKLSQPQVKRLLAKIEQEEAPAQGLRQYEHHLLACEQQYEHNREIRERRNRRKPKSTPDGRPL